MAPGGSSSHPFPHTKPQIPTQASVPRHLCNHLHSLNSICQGVFGAGGNHRKMVNWTLSSTGIRAWIVSKKPFSPFPRLYLPSTLQRCLLPLLFLSYNIEPAKQSVQQMAAEASFTSFKLLFQTSPPHRGKLASWKEVITVSTSHEDKKFSWKIGGMSKCPHQTGPERVFLMQFCTAEWQPGRYVLMYKADTRTQLHYLFFLHNRWREGGVIEWISVLT